ncbi:putative basic proline-rich protein-like [Iris pallida]|uniref:Basic proline-rich protein-like n=1 Tax=Iris pallida TaxID=29817 RepID=A0AAX6FGS6_IRIPA|nr:putative basic proline-rich protein-like [Iris pallida]
MATHWRRISAPNGGAKMVVMMEVALAGRRFGRVTARSDPGPVVEIAAIGAWWSARCRAAAAVGTATEGYAFLLLFTCIAS